MADEDNKTSLLFLVTLPFLVFNPQQYQNSRLGLEQERKLGLGLSLDSVLDTTQSNTRTGIRPWSYSGSRLQGL